MVWCTGPNSPGYNASTHTCPEFSTTTNSIVPHQEQPQSVKLTQLPYTGTADDMVANAAFYGAIIFIAAVAIYRILQYKGWI